MKITSDGKNLIVSIPLKQKIYNPYMENEDLGETANLVGIIAGDEFTISQLIDMDYKDKPPQEGMPIIHFGDRKELAEVCRKYSLSIWIYPVCSECGKALRGTHTIGDKGAICFNCEKK